MLNGEGKLADKSRRSRGWRRVCDEHLLSRVVDRVVGGTVQHRHFYLETVDGRPGLSARFLNLAQGR